MDDLKFATELVRRLNALCEDDAAKAAVLALLDTKVEVGNSLDHHPTCSVSKGGVMGILGISRMTLWRLEKECGFPRPVQFGTGAQRYRSNEVQEYLDGLSSPK